MNRSTLHQINSIKQDRQEGNFTMHGLAFTSLIHSLIREYGKYYDESYTTDVKDFLISDKRLILSHFESAEWYEYACKSVANTEALFDECKDYVQKFLDDECYEVYREDMEEKSCVTRAHDNNGEICWTRK
jgi:hypothetical protein